MLYRFISIELIILELAKFIHYHDSYCQLSHISHVEKGKKGQIKATTWYLSNPGGHQQKDNIVSASNCCWKRENIGLCLESEERHNSGSQS
jgi:hypothetical protein